jgi:large subunit ribosomal protein L4
MPKKMRQLARNSALLAKLQSGSVAVIEAIDIDEPRTKTFSAMLKAVGGDQGCVVAIEKLNPAVYKSGRNIPKTEVRPVYELNAYEILRRRKLLFTKAAFEAVIADPVTYIPADESEL